MKINHFNGEIGTDSPKEVKISSRMLPMKQIQTPTVKSLSKRVFDPEDLQQSPVMDLDYVSGLSSPQTKPVKVRCSKRVFRLTDSDPNEIEDNTPTKFTPTCEESYGSSGNNKLSSPTLKKSQVKITDNIVKEVEDRSETLLITESCSTAGNKPKREEPNVIEENIQKIEVEDTKTESAEGEKEELDSKFKSPVPKKSFAQVGSPLSPLFSPEFKKKSSPYSKQFQESFKNYLKQNNETNQIKSGEKSILDISAVHDKVLEKVRAENITNGINTIASARVVQKYMNEENKEEYKRKNGMSSEDQNSQIRPPNTSQSIWGGLSTLMKKKPKTKWNELDKVSKEVIKRQKDQEEQRRLIKQRLLSLSKTGPVKKRKYMTENGRSLRKQNPNNKKKSTKKKFTNEMADRLYSSNQRRSEIRRKSSIWKKENDTLLLSIAKNHKSFLKKNSGSSKKLNPFGNKNRRRRNSIEGMSPIVRKKVIKHLTQTSHSIDFQSLLMQLDSTEKKKKKRQRTELQKRKKNMKNRKYRKGYLDGKKIKKSGSAPKNRHVIINGPAEKKKVTVFSRRKKKRADEEEEEDNPFLKTYGNVKPRIDNKLPSSYLEMKKKNKRKKNDLMYPLSIPLSLPKKKKALQSTYRRSSESSLMDFKKLISSRRSGKQNQKQKLILKKNSSSHQIKRRRSTTDNLLQVKNQERISNSPFRQKKPKVLQKNSFTNRRISVQKLKERIKFKSLQSTSNEERNRMKEVYLRQTQSAMKSIILDTNCSSIKPPTKKRRRRRRKKDVFLRPKSISKNHRFNVPKRKKKSKRMPFVSKLRNTSKPIRRRRLEISQQRKRMMKVSSSVQNTSMMRRMMKRDEGNENELVVPKLSPTLPPQVVKRISRTSTKDDFLTFMVAMNNEMKKNESKRKRRKKKKKGSVMKVEFSNDHFQTTKVMDVDYRFKLEHKWNN